MTDKELLELAAKAAGLSEYEHMNDGYGYECMAFDPGGSKSDYWNPLRENDDAFLLAVKLHFTVEVERREITVYFYDSKGEVYTVTEGGEKQGCDAPTSTRRAITRAAAEIGKAMP